MVDPPLPKALAPKALDSEALNPEALDSEALDPEAPSLAAKTAGQGLVTAVQANYYWVRLDSQTPFWAASQTRPPQPPILILCTRRSRLKKIGQQVWVGDRVGVEDIDWGSGRGAIAQVMPRQTALERPPVANADLLLLVFSLVEPALDPWQLSRFLVAAESTGIAVALCLNKCDQLSPKAQQQWRDRLGQWGYDPLVISVREGINLGALRQQLAGRISVISGPSGVGKSSLINHLIPAVDQRVNAVSGKLARGRHTTRHVELFELPPVSDFASEPTTGGGLLADSPGFNQPTFTCAPSDLGAYFPEIRQRLNQGSCQFSDCLHRDEPGCIVREDKTAQTARDDRSKEESNSWERYDHYLTFLDEAIARQTALEQTATVEESVKRLSGEAGQTYYEPKLKTKRYRRPSRRSRHQDLKSLCGDIDELLDEGAEDDGDNTDIESS